MMDALEASSETPKVLIADDDPSVVKFLAERCVKMGFEVQTATNGLQALIMAQRNRPDVLIVDVNMPEVDGLSLCHRLLDPGKKGLDAIVITGMSDEAAIDRCENFGATYTRKGPNLWKIVYSALAEKYPGLAQKAGDLDLSRSASEVRSRPRILVIDDDPEVAKFLGSRLRKSGVDMLFATDGILGYRVARREQPSVIISDYFMPGGDVNFLLWRLRSTPETANIPVFVMSGRQLDAAAEENLRKPVCGRPGAARIFKKSFDIRELFGALQEFVALKPDSMGPENRATG